DWSGLRSPLFMLGALALTISAQLVPLPPALWQALPGRAALAEAPQLAGVAEVWRPLSMAPDLTRNSLVSLLAPVAIIIGYAGINARHRRSLMLVLLMILAATTTLGILQITGGATSPAYLYQVTSREA